MASFHHHNHQSPACCCSHRCNAPPPPPPPIDPILLQSIVSQLLQNPQTAHLYSVAPSIAFSAASAPFDLHPCTSQYPQRSQKRPKQKQSQPHRQPFEDQFQDQYSVFSSLLQRIDVLESSLHRFSSATAFSLRHVAARTIQIHFRAHLVRRSRALRELKELASIKSALNALKSSLSLQKRLDFFCLSHEALDLISRLETIQSGDQMVRDSKSSIRREIGRFLELVDEICARRKAISVKTVKHIKMARNDDKPRASYAGRESPGAYHRGKASKRSNSVSDEKLLDNLRERVERIQHISKALKDEEDSADSGDDNSAIGSKRYTNQQSRRGEVAGKHGLQSHAEKRVWFAEDGNATQVYDILEDGKVPMKRVSGNAEKREESVDKLHEEEDSAVESDFEENDAESAEGSEYEDEERSGSLEGSSQGSESEETRRKFSSRESDRKVKPSHPCQEGKLILSAPPPVKMEGRADLVKKQNGVKIIG